MRHQYDFFFIKTQDSGNSYVIFLILIKEQMFLTSERIAYLWLFYDQEFSDPCIGVRCGPHEKCVSTNNAIECVITGKYTYQLYIVRYPTTVSSEILRFAYLRFFKQKLKGKP